MRGGATVPCTASPRVCTEVAPRTAVGVDKEGRLLLLVVDGCENCPAVGEKGLTLTQTAELFTSVGAYHGINLDGGGSSVLYYNGTIVDRPTCSDEWTPVCERAVTTVLCVT